MRVPAALAAVLWAVGCLGTPVSTCARTLLTDSDGNPSIKLATSLEGMGLAAAPPPDLPGSHSTVGAWLGRLRLDSEFRLGGKWKAALSYDNRLESGQGATGLTSTVRASSGGPFRIRQIGGLAARSGDTVDYHELDRAFLSFESQKWSVTAGRQAVGWGRGVLFGAVDIFAPFTPLEIDRDWRRGVDAFRATYKVADTFSTDLVTAWGPDWDHSAAGVRFSGYQGPLDGEVLLAKRGTDVMYGVDGSRTLGGLEVHGEYALFRTRGTPLYSGAFGDPRLVPKAVLGASNNFNLGNGLRVLLEYHYSGFGAAAAKDLPGLLKEADFQDRLNRGDTQILGRQALAAQGTYTFNPSWNVALEILQSLDDPSGVVVPSAGWTLSDSLDFQGVAFIGYGPRSTGGIAQSQYGSTLRTILLRARFYD